MATIDDAKVFEHCERLYRELISQDGGYHPSKQDDRVFAMTAQEFSIPEVEVRAIYDSYTKKVGDITVARIHKLPKSQQKKAMMDKMVNIVRENMDLPFGRTEGPPTEPSEDHLRVLTSEYEGLVNRIAQSGWTIPLSIDIRRFDELESCGDDASLDNFFSRFYSPREIRQACRRIERCITNPGQQENFRQAMVAFSSGLFSVALITLVTVLEGLIATFGDNPQNVRIMRICSFHAQEEKTKRNDIKGLCWDSMYAFTKILFQPSDFTQAEPSTINRHWIEHGRTERIADEICCLRVINALSTMAVIKEYDR